MFRALFAHHQEVNFIDAASMHLTSWRWASNARNM